MLRSYLCDFSDAYIVANATATNKANNNAFGEKKVGFLKITLHLSIAFQILMAQKLIMQKT